MKNIFLSPQMHPTNAADKMFHDMKQLQTACQSTQAENTLKTRQPISASPLSTARL